MKFKAIYLCGDRSRYGLAHLEPILKNFEVVALVVGSDKAWLKFRGILRGGEQYEPPEKKIISIYQFVRRGLSALVRRFRRKKYAINVQDVCRLKGIKLLKIDDVNNPMFVGSIKKISFDVLLSAAYPQILKNEILSLAPEGSINFHPSLLPKFRGAHPHFWSIAKGAEVSGVTAHFMTEQIDDGDIVAQISFPIKEYYYNELYERIEAESHGLVEKVRLFLENGGIPIKQNTTEVSYYRNDRDIHRRIFWDSMTAQEIFDLIRTENAFFFVNGKKVFPKRALIVGENRNMTNSLRVPPGVVVDITSCELVISTKDGNQFLCITDFAVNILKKKGIIPWVRRYEVSLGMRLS